MEVAIKLFSQITPIPVCILELNFDVTGPYLELRDHLLHLL